MSLASTTPVPIPRADFEKMVAFSRLLYRLEQHKDYARLLDKKLEKELGRGLPETAGVIPDTPGILMGFDFHLTGDGPKLIEINNNAGGLYIGREVNRANINQFWLPQPQIPELPGSLKERLLAMFPAHWKSIAIVDEAIETQYMYPEMQAYADMLEGDGRRVFLVSPEALIRRDDGLYVGESRIDAIYNRHTDFYLESEPMQQIRQAYVAGQVQLNPHSRSYALLGDKARMADWWHEGLLESCMSEAEIKLTRSVVPEIHLMYEYDHEQAWAERKDWVFKPAARHGGKGVLLGKSVSRTRFDALDRQDTVMQRFVPASIVYLSDKSGDKPFKFDVRLFTQGEKLIAVAGRVWQGQVTNFRTEGSGWVPLAIAG